MNKVLSLITILLLMLSMPLFAQEDIEDEDIDWNERLIEEVKLENPVYKPIIGVGTGLFAFRGDVYSRLFPSSMFSSTGVNVDIIRSLTPSVKFGFRFLYGNLSGRSFDENKNKRFNFETSTYAFGANVIYNFGNFKIFGDIEKRKFSPYVSVGAEFLNYEVFGDMYSGSDSVHYWSDGTIRDAEEEINNASDATIIYPDYNYETSLQQTNIDEIDNFSTVSIAIPFEAGIDFIISPKISFRIGYSFHLTFDDYIDNITTDGTKYDEYPDRKGDNKKDHFSYTYISLYLDLFSRTTEEKQLQFLDLGAGGIFDFWDMDGDFVMDIFDQCPYTPYGEPVDTVGCPFDDDTDRIYNFEDEEAATPNEAFYVDEKGVEVSEEDILALLNTGTTIDQPEIYRYYPSLLDGTGLYRRFYKSIPEKFKSIDSNSDDYISLEELLKAIDSFFDMDSDLTVDDLYELNEFFFIQ